MFSKVIDIEELGHISHGYAEQAARTEANFSDVRLALKDVNANLDDLRNFALLTEDMPFAKGIGRLIPSKILRISSFTSDIPEFPVKKTNESHTERNGNSAELSQPRPSNIPDFLPPFPNPHTFIHTSVLDDLGYLTRSLMTGLQMQNFYGRQKARRKIKLRVLYHI